MTRKNPAVCLVLLGSNVGDRLRHLKTATLGVARLPKTCVLKISRVYETSPLGPSRRSFLNQALQIKTQMSAMGILIEFKRLEVLAGRKPGKRWGPRPLDIDLILYGKKRMKTFWLSVPHPEAVRRAFVLVPLSEISPRTCLAKNLTVSQALSRLKGVSQTVRLLS